jgi:dipeptidyl aminopeptidase/acylaminoacyl peptidase
MVVVKVVTRVLVLFAATFAVGQKLDLPVRSDVKSRIAYANTFGPSVSADGKWIAFAAGDVAGDQLWAGTILGSDVHPVTQLSGEIRHPQWSPDGTRIAFLYKQKGSYHVFEWSRVSGQLRQLSDSTVCEAPRTRFTMPLWSADGAFVFFLMAPSDPPDASERPAAASEEGAVTVTESTATEGENQAHEAQSQDSNQSRRPLGCDLGMIDVAESKAYRITGGEAVMNYSLSPDGRKLWILTEVGQPDITIRQWLYRLYTMGMPSCGELTGSSMESPQSEPNRFLVLGHPVVPLVRYMQLFEPSGPSWSPDSKWIAYASLGAKAAGDIFVVSAENGTIRNLTASVQLPTSVDDQDESGTNPDFTRSFNFHGKFGQVGAPPVWTPDGSALLAIRAERQERGGQSVVRRSVWHIPVNGAKATELTRTAFDLDFGEVLRTRYGIAVGADARDSVFVTGRDLRTGQNGFVQVGLSTGQARPVSLENRHYLSKSFTAVGGDAKVVAYLAESKNEPIDVWAFHLSADHAQTQVSHLNPALEITGENQQVETRILHWRAASGSEIAGLLILPQGATATAAKLPLITGVYGGTVGNPIPSEDENTYELGNQSPIPPRLLVARGYAVFEPDMPILGFGNTCTQIADVVVTGIDAATATGLIDGDRLGVMGHSFGGYSTNCIVTRTNRFRAAVSMSGLSDLASEYLDVNSLLVGQAQLSGSLWERQDEYIKNSPVFALPSVKTPLLLFHGKRDTGLHSTQSEEMFYGLRLLKREVTLVEYKDGNHGNYLDTEDMWERTLKWFDKHLNKRSVQTTP